MFYKYLVRNSRARKKEGFSSEAVSHSVEFFYRRPTQIYLRYFDILHALCNILRVFIGICLHFSYSSEINLTLRHT